MVLSDAKAAEVVLTREHVDGKPFGWVAPALLEFPNANAPTSTDVEMDSCYAAVDFSMDLSTCIG